MTNVGFRVFTKINRPAAELIEGFRGIPVANVADIMNRSCVLDARIQKISTPDLLGCAFTVKVRPGDNLMLHKALHMAQPGDIIVVDAHGDITNSITGELMMRTALTKKLGGVIIDGAIRDVATLSQLDMPIYAAGVTAAGPYKDGPGEIGTPISVGSVVVHPGDIIIGDDDGIVVVSPKEAPALIEKARKKHADEEAIIKAIEENTRDYSWIDRELEKKGCEIIDDYYR
ncbi:RraA family protein [Bartonella sp. HY761]|uniref:RraA family protein n=1 Tax=Bartonella sp. HY761 TaxID=2979330 RepID=UPI0021F9E44D|nr:RraA family protein [Bartonella sp. HY761]UXN06391.1 RraA family protein [Bartonella sp. HY761]